MMRPSAHARVATILGTAVRVPVLTAVVERTSRDPVVETRSLAGTAASIIRPCDSAGCTPTVFLNGATPLGCGHPAVRRVVTGLARAGVFVVAPELGGLRHGEVTCETVAQTKALVGAATDMSPDGRVALFGVSAGATLALLAAADDKLAPRVRVVAAVAPAADQRRVVRFALTGAYEGVQASPAGLLVAVAARSLAAALPSGADRDLLLAHLPANGDPVSFPLRLLDARVVRRLGTAGRAVAALLANRDAARFDALAAALPETVGAALDDLSPERYAPRIRARVELASAPDDSYIPVGECHALVRALPDARLAVSSTLEHVKLRPSFAALADLARFEAFAARALAGACRR